MATDEVDGSSADGPPDGGADPEPTVDTGAAVDSYTWAEFMTEYGHGDEVDPLYERATGDAELGLETNERVVPEGDDWDTVSFDPESYLGVHPDELTERVFPIAGDNADRLDAVFKSYVDPETTPVVKDVWTWEHYKWEYYYEADGSRPQSADGEVKPHDQSAALGFDPADLEEKLAAGGNAAEELADIVDERTVNVQPELDEDDFFANEDGTTTVVNRYDLEKAVPFAKKRHFREVERYWVNKPYAFVVIFHSEKENEKKYYVIEPYLTEIESELREFLAGKLRTAIKYSDEGIKRRDTEEGRRSVIEEETRRLLKRYDLAESTARSQSETGGIFSSVLSMFGSDDEDTIEEPLTFDGERTDQHADDPVTEVSDVPATVDADGPTDELGDPEPAGSDDTAALSEEADAEPEATDGTPVDGAASDTSEAESLSGIAVRPEPVILAEDPDTLSEYQVEKILHLLKRDFIGYERIDGIKHDINVEDISCDGYNSPVFVYHTEYEQIISNIHHGETELDDFVVKLAQRSGKGISKRLPQVDATLPDGSRAQLTLGTEVSDHGTNYTIRQFKDVPFTPIDLINWNTFSLDEMAFLWLCIENHKSLLFAGGTASGKTTSLNAVSLFIPSNAKIVSIEDTREVELPQRNWIASVTRPSFSDDEQGDVDEFDLLEAALRQRPDYIVMGEIRGEEGRTLFQVMSTGHTTYTTFHADSVDEVLKRFTTDPINVSKTMFTALDLVSIQTQTRVHGQKVRRNKSLTEINHYEAEHDEINVQDVYQWQAETDEYLKMGDSNTLAEIRFDRGWSPEKLQRELFKREVILAYLINNGLNTYAEVAATVQAFINDPETILTLIANDQLEESLADLREMESVLIDVDPEKEALVPRPDADQEKRRLAQDILDRAEDRLFEEYRGEAVPGGLESALDEDEPPSQAEEETSFNFDGEVAEEWEFDGSDSFWEEDGTTQPTTAEGATATATDRAALPPAADEPRFDQLFEDMGETLETLEEADGGTDAAPAGPDSDFEAVFDPATADEDERVDLESSFDESRKEVSFDLDRATAEADADPADDDGVTIFGTDAGSPFDDEQTEPDHSGESFFDDSGGSTDNSIFRNAGDEPEDPDT